MTCSDLLENCFNQDEDPYTVGIPYPLETKDCVFVESCPTHSYNKSYLQPIEVLGDSNSFICCQTSNQYRAQAKKENRISIKELRNERLWAENKIVQTEINKVIGKHHRSGMNTDVLHTMKNEKLIGPSEICVQIIPNREPLYFNPSCPAIKDLFEKQDQYLLASKQLVCPMVVSSNDASNELIAKDSMIDQLKEQLWQRTSSLMNNVNYLAHLDHDKTTNCFKNDAQNVELKTKIDILNNKVNTLLERVEERGRVNKRLRAKFRQFLEIVG